jgi:hypothetical protein
MKLKFGYKQERFKYITGYQDEISIKYYNTNQNGQDLKIETL